MKSAFHLTLLLCFGFLSFIATADVYKWVDENGRTHYGDAKNKPQNQATQSLDLKLNTYTHTTIEQSSQFTEKVVMYSTEWCGYCKQAKKYFIANRIPFVEYDIEKNPQAKQRYGRLGATGVPVILYKGKRMNGFSEAGFNNIYGGDT